MEREVRYCPTNDGVSIAYWTFGSGPPLVYIPEPVLTASEADDKLPITRRWNERMARERTVVRFDHRGTGLSEHNDDYSLDALCMDVDAVVGAMELPSFDLWGDMDGGIIAAAFAATQPQRVNHLILWNSWARAADVPESETLQTLDRLIDLNWPLYARTAASMDSDWTSEELAQYAGYIEANCDPAIARPLVTATWEFDIEELLPQIDCPTLVLHRRDHRYFPLSLGRHLAARIPNARFAIVEGRSFYPWFEHPDAVMELVDGFAPAGSAKARQRDADSTRSGGVQTVLFTDLVGHTEMMRRLGDARGREVLREHERIVRDAIREHGGNEIKTDGDSFMVSFASVASGMRCAVAIQRAIAERNEGAEEPLRLRMGMNAGEPIEDGSDLFGEAVILAARIRDQAGESEILIAEPVRHLLAGKGFVFTDRGTFVPKGFEDAVRLFEVRWRD
jgi:class 3 adenylate cyclase/pimeloyl-ACP methyl ester carboxylesterase